MALGCMEIGGFIGEFFQLNDRYFWMRILHDKNVRHVLYSIFTYIALPTVFCVTNILYS